MNVPRSQLDRQRMCDYTKCSTQLRKGISAHDYVGRSSIGITICSIADLAQKQLMSALPPKADVNPHSLQRPLIAKSGHSIDPERLKIFEKCTWHIFGCQNLSLTVQSRLPSYWP